MIFLKKIICKRFLFSTREDLTLEFINMSSSFIIVKEIKILILKDGLSEKIIFELWSE